MRQAILIRLFLSVIGRSRRRLRWFGGRKLDRINRIHRMFPDPV
jgi:hypothetical protein